MKPKISPLSGQELYKFIAEVCNLEGGMEVLGTPEATVLSVYDVYAWHKWMYEWYDELEHYKAIIKSRFYPKEQEKYLIERISPKTTILDFIKLILETENLTLSEEEINSLIEKYNKTRGRIYQGH